MKIHKRTTALLLSLFSLSALAQGPVQKGAIKLWLLDGHGEVHTLQPEPEIIIDLPGGATMEMVLIPAGSFMMGSSDYYPWVECFGCEQPVHAVTIGYNFYMGKTEVTQGQWWAVMGHNPGTQYGWGSNYPVHQVLWNETQLFIAALNELGQGTFSLPSEAEWEYACRAGTTTRFYFGDTPCSSTTGGSCEMNDYAWWNGNRDSRFSPNFGTKPVGGKLPNTWGLYDMHGNVDEWCLDYWYDSYDGAPSNGFSRTWPTTGYHVFRGGNFFDRASKCRSANRDKAGPFGGIYLGLRVVREAEPGSMPRLNPTPTPLLHTLSISPRLLDFGRGLVQLSFDISNIGTGPLNWTVSESQTWLRCQSAQGDTTRSGSYSGTDNETVTVIVDRTGLPEGFYSGDITVVSDQDSEEVRVRMSIGRDFRDLTIILPGGATMEMVLIPPGSFMMGRYPGEQDSISTEDPQHQVTIGYDFYMGKYEVTKAQWQAVMGTTPWEGLSYVLGDPDSPAVYISWYFINGWDYINGPGGFIAKMNALGQGTFRLPSEAEWEYACRAGTTTRFYWGDDPSDRMIGDYAWYRRNASSVRERYAHVVGLKLPNAWGLYDMNGNAWEWCQDYWHDNYGGVPSNGSAWESPTSSYRVLRGGHWSDDAQNCRSARRTMYYPVSRGSAFGFRLVRTP